MVENLFVFVLVLGAGEQMQMWNKMYIDRNESLLRKYKYRKQMLK